MLGQDRGCRCVFSFLGCCWFVDELWIYRSLSLMGPTKVSGPLPLHRLLVSQIFKGDIPVLMNRDCSIPMPSISSATVKTGYPTSWIQRAMLSLTRTPDASLKAFQRSSVVAFP
jgi:hypothetical protein